MSDPIPPAADDAPDPAAEYVLGLLDGPARAAAGERVRADPTFRAEVEAWERRLAPLLDQVAPAEPPAGVWRRIAAATQPGANVVALPPRPGLWNRTGVWRAATAVSLAAAAACVAIVVLRPIPAPAPAISAPAGPMMTATLTTGAGKPLFVAAVEPSGAGVTIVPVADIEGHGRFPELWIIPAGGKPKPVGMIGERRPLSLALAGVRPSDVLAVSLEPRAGSPTGAPTGPVIATGALRDL
jgi:anti-sigma-K factor RskA